MNQHTGPRSPEGKAASSRNATRHGLTAHQPVVTQADQPLFDTMCNELLHTLNPSGFLEDLTFQRILIASWNMQRVLQLESGLLAKSAGQDPLSHPDTRKDAELYQPYRSGLRELENFSVCTCSTPFSSAQPTRCRSPRSTISNSYSSLRNEMPSGPFCS